MTNPEPRVPEANSATATDFPLTWRETQIAACQNRIASYRQKIQGLKSRDHTKAMPSEQMTVEQMTVQQAHLTAQPGQEELILLEAALLKEQARLQRLDPEDLLD
jgi:hypothetical protein